MPVEKIACAVTIARRAAPFALRSNDPAMANESMVRGSGGQKLAPARLNAGGLDMCLDQTIPIDDLMLRPRYVGSDRLEGLELVHRKELIVLRRVACVPAYVGQHFAHTGHPSTQERTRAAENRSRRRKRKRSS